MKLEKETLKNWFLEGKDTNHDYMIIVKDTFDYDQYPVYASVDNFWSTHSKFNNVNMQQIVRVYNLKMSLLDQLHGIVDLPARKPMKTTNLHKAERRLRT